MKDSTITIIIIALFVSLFVGAAIYQYIFEEKIKDYCYETSPQECLTLCKKNTMNKEWCLNLAEKIKLKNKINGVER